MNRYFIPENKSSKGDVVAAIQMVARQARTHYARHLLETGLYAGQENVIELLAANEAMTPGQIAKALGVRPPTITKTIARLEEQGFVQRAPSANDGRQVQVTLSENGRAILEAVADARRKAEKEAMRGIKKKDRKQLVAFLAAIAVNLATPSTADDTAEDDD